VPLAPGESHLNNSSCGDVSHLTEPAAARDTRLVQRALGARGCFEEPAP